MPENAGLVRALVIRRDDGDLFEPVLCRQTVRVDSPGFDREEDLSVIVRKNCKIKVRVKVDPAGDTQQADNFARGRRRELAEVTQASSQ